MSPKKGDKDAAAERGNEDTKVSKTLAAAVVELKLNGNSFSADKNST